MLAASSSGVSGVKNTQFLFHLKLVSNKHSNEFYFNKIMKGKAQSDFYVTVAGLAFNFKIS
jgi:hypothetical protein